MLTHTGGGKRPRALSKKMAKSFLNSIRTGNPNGDSLPARKPYTTQNGKTRSVATVILYDAPVLANNSGREVRKALA